MDYIYSARVGTNDVLFLDILRLYVKPGSIIADVTFYRGIFWKRVDLTQYHLLPSDISPAADWVLEADCRSLPYPDASIDAVVFDPPYLYVGGWKTLTHYFNETTHTSTYGNKERAARGILGVEAVDRLYYDGMKEAHRVLRPKGILIVKCMDQVMSGKQEWAHVQYMEYAKEIGFDNEDLFVLVRSGGVMNRHKPENQKHARRNHSYFLVQRKRRV